MTDFAQLISDAAGTGELNPYMAKKLSDASEFGMTDAVFEQALDDAKCSSKAGIDDDHTHSTRFFIINIADDLLDDTFGKTILPDERELLCKYILDSRGDKYKLDNLTDFRILTHKWLCDKHTKTAYPNTMGKDDREPVYNIKRWTDTAKVLYSLLKEKGLDKKEAMSIATYDWGSDERFKFTHWLDYYESGNTEKYNVKTANLKKEAIDIDDLGLPAHMLDTKTRSNNLESLTPPEPRVSMRKTKKDKELERARALKQKMKSRLISLKRLLNKYNDILPHQSVDQVHDEMYALDKSLSKLNIYASVQDRIIRAANKIKSVGFTEGADLLYKAAEEPNLTPRSEPEVIESLPEPVPNEPDLPQGSGVKIDVQTIITRLEGVSKKLKSRDTIRELASIDILLNELGIASIFPELTDAQSKLIESYGYSSNKIESIIAKLRGMGTAGPMGQAPIATKPKSNIDKRQLQEKPVQRVRKELPTG